MQNEKKGIKGRKKQKIVCIANKVFALLNNPIVAALSCIFFYALLKSTQLDIEMVSNNVLGSVVSVMSIVWSFMVAVTIFCLEKLDQRYFGIRMADSFLEEVSLWKLILLMISIVMQLIMLYVVAFAENIYTLLWLIFLQIYTMLYLFAMLLTKVSQTAIIEQVKHEIKQVVEGTLSFDDAPLIESLLVNVDYSSYSERVILQDLLKNFDWYAKNDEMNSFNVSIKVVSQIIRACGYNENVMAVLQEWIKDTENLFVKSAILCALLDEEKEETYQYVDVLMRGTKTHEYRSLCIWLSVYSLYQSQMSGKQWRRNDFFRFAGRYNGFKYDEDIEQALRFWHFLNRGYDNTFVLWKNIDRYRNWYG